MQCSMSSIFEYKQCRQLYDSRDYPSRETLPFSLSLSQKKKKNLFSIFFWPKWVKTAHGGVPFARLSHVATIRYVDSPLFSRPHSSPISNHISFRGDAVLRDWLLFGAKGLLPPPCQGRRPSAGLTAPAHSTRICNSTSVINLIFWIDLFLVITSAFFFCFFFSSDYVTFSLTVFSIPQFVTLWISISFSVLRSLIDKLIGALATGTRYFSWSVVAKPDYAYFSTGVNITWRTPWIYLISNSIPYAVIVLSFTSK